MKTVEVKGQGKAAEKVVILTVKGQTLKIVRIANGDSGKVTVTLVGGQEITYRPPAADLIRAAFKPKEKPAEKWTLFKSGAKPVKQ